MEPLEFLNWSGRIRRFNPPAIFATVLPAVNLAFSRSVWLGAKVAKLFNAVQQIENGGGKTGVAIALAFLVLCGLPNAGQAQTGSRIVVWGLNADGITNVPPGLTNVIAIAAGTDHCLALQSDGTVVAWGWNGYGQTNVPPDLSNVVAIAAGGDFSLALKANGAVVAWGSNGTGQTNVPPGLNHVKAIPAGSDFGLALSSNGTVVAWGNNVAGQIQVPSGLGNVVSFAAGGYQCRAVQSNGTVVAWGQSGWVPSDLSNAVAVAVGGGGYFGHTLVLKSDGTVAAWGDNSFGQTDVPPGLSHVIAIAAGFYHSLALKSDHTIAAWGAGEPGQSEGVDFGQSKVPADLSGVMAIAAGGYRSMALVFGPMVDSLPKNQMAALGSTVEFHFNSSGVAPLANQWFFNATNLVPGATNDTLQFTNIQLSQSGVYTLVASNCWGTVTSSPAILVVIAEPVILSQPTNQNVGVGLTANFSGAGFGPIPLTYQWFLNSDAISSATNPSIHLTNVQAWQAGAYTVVITNIYGAVTSAPAMLRVYSAIIVTNCTEADLRAAMAIGCTVRFACDGTITLSNTITCSANTAFDGAGHNVTISGNNKVQVFYVNPNVTLSVSNLTVADGFASNGAGLFNNRGTVNLNDVTFRRNYAPLGGAVYNAAGHMNLQSCCFTNNRAWAINVSQATFGGAIYNADSMYLDLCQFGGNSAGGAGGTFVMGIGSVAPADGSGGAIYNSGQLTIDRTTLIANVAFGGGGYTGTADYYTWNGDSGGSGANGFGGGICNAGSLSISRSTLCGNIVEGGGGGQGGNGIWFMDIGGSGGAGSFGGSGTGGALYGGGSLVNCTIAFNTAQGGTGGAGGAGAGGIPGPSGYGGNGGNGGNGIDGGVSGSGSFVNCTIAGNQSVAGAAGAGGYAPAYGATGLPGSAGSAWGATPTGFQLNVLLCSNTPDGNDTFANLRLGPLADNGGPTLTMELLPGSPAIDAGTAVGAPATDQRGVPRTQGTAPDIGAFEYLYTPVFTGVTLQNTTNRQLQVSGFTPDQTLTLQASTNLLDWFDFTNIVGGANGAFQCFIPVSTPAPQHDFFRLKSDSP